MAPVRFRVNEKTTARYTAQIVDELNVGIPAASLSTLTLTLYGVVSGTILNSRNAQNVLNANGVTVDSSGNLVWTMAPADNAILGTQALETHAALFVWTWAGTKEGRHEVIILVDNLQKVT